MSITYIDTAPKEVKVAQSSKGRSKVRLFLKTVFLSFSIALGFSVFVGLVLAIVLVPRTQALLKQVDVTYSHVQKVQAALTTDKDLKAAEKEVAALKVETAKTKSDFEKLSFLKFIPFVGYYYTDGEHLLNSALIGIDLSNQGLVAIDPFASILGFKGSQEKSITAEQKAQTIVRDVIPKLVPLVGKVATGIGEIKNELDQIDPNRYPDGLEVKRVKIKKTLVQVKKDLDKVNNFIPELKPILQTAPELAGEPTAKTYLVLLQNDKELRPTGGFITAYALVKLQGGKIVSTESDDIYNLDLKYRPTEKAPEAIRKYIGWSMLPIRDSNISPDYRVAAEKFETMYNTIPRMPKVDGVFALDTEFVRSMLAVTGPIKTKETKETWSAANNALGIPDVIYKLELHAERINTGKKDRKGFVGELMNALIDKVMNAKPDEMQKYLEAFIDTGNRKHILFYFHNSVAQNLVEKYNFAGRIKDYSGDYFHLNNANFGGLKGNLYIKQKVEQDIQIAADGSVTKSVNVTLTNPVKADGWLSSIYLNWMRIYVPKDSILISKNVYKDFTSGTELNKEVYRGYGPTLPLNSSTFNFTYKLPFKVDPVGKYNMLIQKQPGVDNIDMIIKINGVTRENFKLNTDREISIQL